MLLVLSTSLALFAAGCSHGLGTVPVTGTVTFNGEAVELANVMFMRVDETGGPAAIAITDTEGRFDLRTNNDNNGAVPGEYGVTVQKDTSVYMEFPDPFPQGFTKSGYMRSHGMIPQPLLPLKYGNIMETLLTFTVNKDGDNHFDIKLEGEKPAPIVVPVGPALP